MNQPEASPQTLAAAHPRSGGRVKTFFLNRKVDLTGVSGTGRVAEGVVFSNGWVALSWLSQQPSVTVFASIEEVEIVHGHGGSTDIVFD